MAARRAKKKKKSADIDGIAAIDFDALEEEEAEVEAAEPVEAEPVEAPKKKAKARPKSKAGKTTGKNKRRKSADVDAVPPKKKKGRGRRSEPEAEAPRGKTGKRGKTKARRRSEPEMGSRRPSREAKTQGRGRTQKRGQRRPSGGQGAKQGQPPWLIPAVSLGALLLVIIIGVAMSGGKSKSNNDDGGGTNSAVASSGGASGGASGGSHTTMTGEQAELYEELKASLAANKVEKGDLVRALASAREIHAVASENRFSDLETDAGALVKQIEAELRAFFMKEYDERKKEVNEYLAKVKTEPLKILDALMLFDAMADYFKDRAGVPKEIGGLVTKLGTTVRGQMQTAIDTQIAYIEGCLDKGKWTEAREGVADLKDYGEKAEKIADGYGEKLETRKKEYYQKRLAKIRKERKAKGVTRLANALAAIKARKEKFTQLLAARTEKARNKTLKKPISVVALRDKTKFMSCRVDQIGENKITLSGKYRGKRVKARAIDWNLLEPHSRMQLMQLMLTDDDAPGYVELGKYCITHEKYDEAEKAFEKAVGIDSKLKGTLPKIEEFRKKVTYSNGKEAWKGDRLQIEFDFEDEKQMADFGIGKNTDSLKIEKGQLMCRVRTLRSLGGSFEYQTPLHFQVKPGTLPPGGYLVLQVDYSDKASKEGGGGAALLLGDGGKKFAVMEGNGAAIAILLLGQRILAGQDFKECTPDQTINIIADKDKINILLGEKTVFAHAGEIGAVGLTLSGYSRNRKAMVGIDKLLFEGRLSKSKYERAVKEKKANRVRKLHTRLSKAGGRDRSLPEIPKEHVERLNHDEHQRWKMMLQALKKFMKGEQTRAVVTVRFQEFHNENPSSAAFYFYRGYFRTGCGQYAESIDDYDRAVELDNGFAEPLVFKAQLLSWTNRHAKSREALAHAFELRPDHPMGRALKARLTFYKGGENRAKALDLMEVARELDPGDQEISTQLEQLRAVIQGPPWPKGKPRPIESKHFIVHTDLEEAQAKLFLSTLERIRGEYLSHFPMRDVKADRKGTCFVFATRATYSIYYQLTLGGRADNTWGYYHPGFKDIHLFENPGDIERLAKGERSETLDTLHHEAWHQYIDRLIPGIPRWINEGMAEYFGAMTYKDGKVVHNLQDKRLPYLLAYRKRGDTKKLKDLVTSTDVDFMRYDVGYGHAWTIAHLCMVRQPDKYRTTLMTYLEQIREGKSRELAYDESFGKIDLEAMERDWSAMLDKMAVELKELQKK